MDGVGEEEKWNKYAQTANGHRGVQLASCLTAHASQREVPLDRDARLWAIA